MTNEELANYLESAADRLEGRIFDSFRRFDRKLEGLRMVFANAATMNPEMGTLIVEFLRDAASYARAGNFPYQVSLAKKAAELVPPDEVDG